MEIPSFNTFAYSEYALQNPDGSWWCSIVTGTEVCIDGENLICGELKITGEGFSESEARNHARSQFNEQVNLIKQQYGII